MFRKLSLAMALAIGITPFGANALGLGEINLKSALNQHFMADINLLSVNADELQDVKVTLASSDAFERAGIERPYILTKLRFKTLQTPGGKFAVKVTSREPIREPFLNFLIEVNWPKGKLVREYTVLLDPPVTLDRKPAQIEGVNVGGSGQASTSPSAQQSGGGASGQYVTVEKNDTLWGVAKKTRHSGASMNQMMVALFEANPQAFIKNNINYLKSGEVLRVPTRDEIQALSRAEANSVYRDHLTEWRADRKPAAAMTESATPQGEASQATAGEAAEESPAPAAELKIASARPEGSGASGPDDSKGEVQVVEELQQELIAAAEEKEVALQEGEELRSRVGDLESQLEDLQRLLTLKNEQFAQLQAAVGDQATAEAMAESTTTPESEAAGEEVKVAGESGAEEAMTGEMETASQPVAETAPVADEMKAAPKPEPAVAESKPAQAKPVAKPAEKSVLERLGADPTMLGVAVAIVVVLLALLWVIISRRKSSGSDFQESILISTIDDADSEQHEPSIMESHGPISEETSFLSDFSPSDIDALQDETGEVDPMAEADVYIAYGRYQQAEELIRQAIEKAPERDELKYKLFEILFAIKDQSGFVSLAEAGSVEGLDLKDDTAWGKVVAMGTQLAPEHSLFSGAGADASSLGQEMVDELDSLKDELTLDEGGDLDLDDSTTLNESDAFADSEGQADDIDGLDMDSLTDLDDLDKLPFDEDSEEAGTIDADSLDLNLDFSDLDDVSGELSADEGTDVDDDSLDLSVLSDDLELADDSELKIDDPMEKVDSFSLDDLEEDSVMADLPDSEYLEMADSLGDDQAVGDDQDDADIFNLDMDSTLPEQDSEGVFTLDGGDDEVTDLALDSEDVTDEANTKMDLARAYVDMGDVEGARSILDEVVSEGSDEQRREAQELLENLT